MNLLRFWLPVLLSSTVAFAQTARKPPTRPGGQSSTPPIAAVPAPAPATDNARPFPGYVSINDVAAAHGLSLAWMEPQKRVVLTSAEHRVEIEAGSRDSRVDGLRVFLGDPARLVDGQIQISRVDAERLLPGLLKPSAAERPQLRVIAIDAGHGGTDTGTRNAALGLIEKEFALDVSQRLRQKLEALGYRVVMTRETDIDVALGARAIIANSADADLFVSIHFNSVGGDGRTRGAEVFTFAPQYQRSTNAWGKGQVDDTEVHPAPVNRFDTMSASAAHAIHAELIRQLGADDRGQKIAHWGVLRPLACPGVLVEAGFLSNDAEGRKIASPEYRQKIADAIAEGIATYAVRLKLRSR